MTREYNEEIIDGIYLAASESLNNFKTKLEEKEKDIESDANLSNADKNYLIHLLGDDHYENNLIRELSSEMVIVGLYKTVEIVIKLMLKYSELFTDREQRNIYRIAELKKEVKKKVVDIETLDGFSSYDELRCINNTIKHNDNTVQIDLAHFNNWTKGDKLSKLWNHYNKLKPGVRKFVYKLSEKLLDKIGQ